MARSRTLKPSFFTSEQLAACAPLARLLFAGLWTIADRDGKLRDRPRKIKAELLPYEAQPDCDAELSELASNGLVLRYEVDGERYLKVLGFKKHQNPHPKEPASEIPEPCTSTAAPRTSTAEPDQSASSREKESTSPAVSCFPSPVSPLPSTDPVAAARPRPLDVLGQAWKDAHPAAGRLLDDLEAAGVRLNKPRNAATSESVDRAAAQLGPERALAVALEAHAAEPHPSLGWYSGALHRAANGKPAIAKRPPADPFPTNPESTDGLTVDERVAEYQRTREALLAAEGSA